MTKLRTAGAIGVLALVAAACGGSDGPDATSAVTEATVPVATTLAATTTVPTGEVTTTVATATTETTAGLPATTLPATTLPPTTAAPTTAAPTTPDAAGIQLPATAVAVSMSWPAADDGWVLGDRDDGTRALLHTTDAGATWTAASTVDATPAQEVVFADPQNGWLAGDDGLRSTHDGGATWSVVAIPGGDDAVPAVAAAEGVVHVAYLGSGLAGIGIASSPVDHDAFVPASLVIPFGAGPVMDVTMTAGGPYAALVYNDRTLTGGAEIRSGAWVSWDLPCPAEGAPFALAGLSPGGDALAMSCSPSGFGDPAAIVGANLSGGSVHWVEIEPAADPSVGMARLAMVAATDAGVRLVVFSGAGSTTEVIAASADGGATWPIRTSLPADTIATSLAHLPDGSLLVATSPAGGIASADGLAWAPIGTSTAVS